MSKRMSFILKYFATLFIWIKLVVSLSPNKNIIYSMDGSIDDIADYISSKGYIPNEKELSGGPVIKNNDNDATYILSKLSDEELLRLLTEQPQRNEYNLNDIMKITYNTKAGRENILKLPREYTQNRNTNNLEDTSIERKRYRTVTNNEPLAYYRLNNKPVEDQSGQNDASYNALQKLKNLLNVYPQPKQEDNYDDADDKKQLLFDILVAQLKTLCCKKSKRPDSSKGQYKTIMKDVFPSLLKHKIIPNRISNPIDLSNKYNEFMFLIINDEIKSNGSDELIEVDPESLDGNSSVLLLGPVTSPLSDDQLKLVMSRISKELTKPEYISLLQQLSNGMLSDNNKNLMKDFVFGPKTRRYIKPHRCNHQSKLAKVYGGPKWIVLSFSTKSNIWTFFRQRVSSFTVTRQQKVHHYNTNDQRLKNLFKYLVDVSYIKGIHSNLNTVYYYLDAAKLALFVLMETQISPGDTSSNVMKILKYFRGDICCYPLKYLDDKLFLLWAYAVIFIGGHTLV